MSDLALSLALLGVTALAAGAYGMRVALRGPARSERIERGGSSVFLGRDAQEVGYFALQPLARVCVRLGVSANAVTLASLLFGAAAGVAIGLARPGLAALLSTLCALCDGLDGLVARQSGTASDSGETFDAAVDRYVEFFFFAGLVYYFRASPPALGLVLLALIGSFMVSYATAKAEALQVDAPRGSMRRVERAVYLTFGVGMVPVAAVLAARAGQGSWLADAPLLAALAIVGVFANISAVVRLRKIAALVAPPAPVSQRPRTPSARPGHDGAHSEVGAASSLVR